MKTLQVITLGCSKNDVDTSHILGALRGLYEVVPGGADVPVDVLLVNTCGFIGDAKKESIDTILSSAARKAEGKVGKLVVCGCLSQRYPSELPELIPEVDAWFGARSFGPLIRFLGGRYSPSKPLERVRGAGSPPYDYLKISEGCDRRCSYCAIPLIRGRHRSVPLDVLVKEAEALVSDGVRELELIAQDTTFYGLDLYGERALSKVLRSLSEIDGLERLRIHYAYPDGFPSDVLDEIASNPKVCKYLDIPLQHCSDKVLKAMRRHIDGARTRELVHSIRERVPGIVLRTTLMVGHPGEDDDAFMELLDFVRDERFERMGAFAYSEEEGTYGAAHFRDEIPQEIKNCRLDELMEVQRGISFAFNQSRIGKVETVLVDSYLDGFFVCRSEAESPEVDGEILLRYDSGAFGEARPENVVGRFLKVRLTAADAYDMTAELI